MSEFSQTLGCFEVLGHSGELRKDGEVRKEAPGVVVLPGLPEWKWR